MLKVLLVFLLITSISGLKSFEDYKVYNVVPNSERHIQMLNDLKRQGYDFWTDTLRVGSVARIMVSPDNDEKFIQNAEDIGLQINATINNVQELINAQLKPAQNTGRNSTLGNYSWDVYHNLEKIYAWLDEIALLYPDVVTTMSIGRSYEGRELKGVVIDFQADKRGEEPLIGIIEGGIHAREWISPATVTWIIKEFLTSNDTDTRFMAETFIWHIIPVTNPDGYKFSFDRDRMWRKNRNPTNHVNCSDGDTDIGNGIDLNRNFDFLWMTGASSDPCDIDYAGPYPGSELETQAIKNYVLRLKETGNVIYYFSFHNSGQWILIPYSHLSGSDEQQSPNFDDMYEIARYGVEKLKQRHGTIYLIGALADFIYQFQIGGMAIDWLKKTAEIPIVYLIELRDEGEYGFLLPPEEIIPNNEEIMDGLVAINKMTKKLGYYSGSVSVYSSAITLILNIAILIFMS